MRSLSCFRLIPALLLAALLLVPAGFCGRVQQYDFTVTIAADGTVGTTEIGPLFGTLRAVRVVAPNMAGTTLTLSIRDEGNVIYWTKASIAENTTTWLKPSADSGWTAGMPPVLTSGVRSGQGLGGASTDFWDLTATSSTTESTAQAIVVTLQVEIEEN